MTSDLFTIAADWLSEPWSSAITLRAMAVVTLLGLTSACVGTWVLLHGATYAAESLSHAMLPGLVASALVGLPLVLGGLGGLALAAGALVAVGRVGGLGTDAAVAVVVTGLTGVGALGALTPGVPRALDALLFGDLLGVTGSDLALAAALAVLTAASMAPLHSRLAAVGFDRSLAGSLIRSPNAAELALLGLVVLAIAVGIQAMGNLLVFALLIGPAATARLLAAGISSQMVVASVVAVAGGLSGIYVSFHASVAAGASVALSLVSVYVLAAAWRARCEATVRRHAALVGH